MRAWSHTPTSRVRRRPHPKRTHLLAAVALILLSAACEPSLRTPPPPDTAAELEAIQLSDGLRPAVSVQGEEEISWRLRDRLEHHAVPGLSLAVIDGGELRFAKAWGRARAGTEEALTPTTLFQASSISKAISATVALRLVEEGKLELDRDLRPTFSGWGIATLPTPTTDAPATADASATTAVTLRQLLSHTAGSRVQGFPGYLPKDLEAEPDGLRPPSLEAILLGQPPATNPAVVFDTPAGSFWRYSGGGYALLEKLLQEASGQPFEELVQQELFEPLEMGASHFALRPTEKAPDSSLSAESATVPSDQVAPGQVAPGHDDQGQVATGHDDQGRPLAGGYRLFPEKAAAGLWSSPTDLAKWLTDLQKAHAGKPARRLRRESVRQMTSDQVPHETPDASPMTWGLGLLLGGSGQSRWIAHLGGNPGFPSLALAFISSGHGAVIMTNGDGGHALLREVVTGLAEVYGWPDFQPRVRTVQPLTAVEQESLVGSYSLRAMPGQILEIAAIPHPLDDATPDDTTPDDATPDDATPDDAPGDGTAPGSKVPVAELAGSFLGATSALHAESAGALFDLEQGWEIDIRARDDDGRASVLEVRLFPGYRFRAERIAGTDVDP